EEDRLKEIITQVLDHARKDIDGKEQPIREAQVAPTINWNIISEMMGGTRSRIQCRYKWKKIMKMESVNKLQKMDSDIQQWLIERLYELSEKDPYLEANLDWDALALTAPSSKIIWNGVDLSTCFARLKTRVDWKGKTFFEIVAQNMKSEEQSRSQSKDLKTTRKRNRVPVSCRVCRKRKVKCDKQQPHCLNCIKNNVQHLCVYAKPDWAKDSPPPEATIDNDPKPVTVKQEDTNERLELAHSLQKELDEMKLKVKALESENNELKKKMVNIPTVNEVTSTTSSLLVKPRDTDDLLDSIFNSNILFLAQQGNHYNIHITYQISVFSWMFIIKSDIYLNDLWMKILKLRQHYEYYYHKGTMEKNMISQYRNFKMKSLSPQIIPKEKTNEHTSKLKNFLEKSLNIKRATNHRVQSPTTLKNDITGEIEVSTPSSMLLQKQPQHPNKCPVTGVVGVCPIGENIMNSPLKSSNGQNHNAEDTAFDPKTQENKLND
ncbi:hypothetical protein JL09_g5058, partial [Pichia kudriavzevii]